MPFPYHVAWWILENLFDENAPASRRTDKVFRAIKKDIAGWAPQRRDRKVAQLESVIVQMNAGRAPDLLGVCEMENRFVLDLLVDAVKDSLPTRSYSVVHAGTDDARGIDVAFLYDPSKFDVLANETFFHSRRRLTAAATAKPISRSTHRSLSAALGRPYPRLPRPPHHRRQNPPRSHPLLKALHSPRDLSDRHVTAPSRAEPSAA